MQTHATTILFFTDLVNSTELLQRAGDERAQRIFRAHHRILSDAVAGHGGHEVKWLGDGLMVVFHSAVDAVRCAIDVQQAARRTAAGELLRVRVGLHAGEPLRDESDYFGTPVVVARRLCDAAAAGEILASDLLPQLIADPTHFAFVDRGRLDLKGIAAPVSAVEVQYEQQAPAAGRRSPFVGRATELDALERMLAEARRGRGGVVMLAGEPGIGKTRLAEEFTDSAHVAGAMTLWGRCYEGDSAPPFSPFVEAMKQYASTASPDELRRDLGSHAAVLGRIVPSLLPAGDAFGVPQTPPQLEGERFRLLDAVASWSASLAQRSPLVMVLDDLHWADRGTVALLLHLARRTEQSPIFIVGTYRDVDLDAASPLTAALADLRRQSNTLHLALSGLAPDDVAQLLAAFSEGAVPSDVAENLRSKTSGNPLFIREVLIHAAEESEVPGGQPATKLDVRAAGMQIPPGVKEIIGQRFVRLSTGCRRMLTTASAMAEGFVWPVMREVSEDDEDTILDALEEALGARLLREDEADNAGRYEFAHALIRQTLYDSVSTPRRVLLHRRIAEAMERVYAHDLDAHASELGEHFLQAAPGGDIDRAIDYAVRAAGQAKRMLAYDDVLAQYERALEACRRKPVPDPQRECSLLLDVSTAAELAGAWERATETRWQGAALARDLGDAGALTRAALLGQRIAGAVDADDIGLLNDALAAVGEGDSPARASLLGDLAVALYWADATPQREAHARESVAMARRLGDPAALVASLQSARSALRGPENIEERLAMSGEAIALAQSEASLPQLRMRLREGYAARAEDLLELGEIAEADTAATLGLQQAEEFRVSYDMEIVGRYRTMRALFDGRFDEVDALIAASLQHRGPYTSVPFFAAAQLLVLRWEQGRIAEIEPAIQLFVANSPTIPAWRTALAFLYANMDRREDVEREFEVVARNGFADLPADNSWLIALVLLTECCAYLGDAGRGAMLYSLLEPYKDRNVVIGDMDVCVGSAGRSLGLLATTVGDWERADRHFTDALTMNRRMQARPWVARTLYNHAAMLLSRSPTSDNIGATRMLGEARAMAQEMGMAALLRQIDGMSPDTVHSSANVPVDGE